MLPQSHANGISGKRILKGDAKRQVEKSKMPSSLGKISFPIDSELVNKIFQSSLKVLLKK